MADQNFPQIPSGVWWKLRDALKRTIPAKITDTYLASILNVKKEAAGNYLRDLRLAGIVNEDGSPAEIVVDWRDDEKYSAVAEQMLNAIYPDELRASAPPPDPDRKRVVRWFMQALRLGEGAAGNKAAFYCLLASGELQKSVPAQKADSRTETTKSSSNPAPAKPKSAPPASNAHMPPRTQIEPNIQLNIQIHISADATKDQIDAIFASMATHLRR